MGHCPLQSCPPQDLAIRLASRLLCRVTRAVSQAFHSEPCLLKRLQRRAKASTTVREVHLHPVLICEACYTDVAYAVDQRVLHLAKGCHQQVPPCSALRRPRGAAGNCALYSVDNILAREPHS